MIKRNIFNMNLIVFSSTVVTIFISHRILIRFTLHSNTKLKFPRNSSGDHAQQHGDHRIDRGVARFRAKPMKIII